MMGEESMVSCSPAAPTRIGHVPTFWQWLAKMRYGSGGSTRDTNPPLRDSRMVCAETSECSRADSRVSAPPSSRESFEICMRSLNKAGSSSPAETLMLPATVLFSRTILPPTDPTSSQIGSYSRLADRRNGHWVG